jgi:hypothetical protein
MKIIKTYVQVIANFDSSGKLIPQAVIWEDGRKYEIDRVSEIKQAASMKVGGQGDRYTIVVNGQPRYLFFERSTNILGNNIGRWFVEAKVA